MAILRVMTFNIHGNDPEWVKDRAAMALVIMQRYSPDVLGLQEVVAPNLAYFQDQLTGYGIEPGLEYNQGKAAAHCSILWKESRFDLLEAGQFWFSRTPEVRSSDWGVDYPLGAAWVRLQDKTTSAQLLHLNTHFEYCPIARQSHEESSQLILQRLQQLAPGLPVVITGDFNCNPWSAAYNTLLAGGFIDTYRAAGNGDSVDSGTYHGFKGPQYFNLDGGDEVFWRVDWILARQGTQPLQTSSCTIVREAAPPLYPSDHYPVVSEIVML